MARSRLSAGFWIAADPGTGGGHATRAARLCAALETRGVGGRLYCETPDFARRLLPVRTEIVPLRGRSFAECCRSDALSIAVVDRPHRQPATDDELLAIRGACESLVAFDDNDREGRFATIHTSALSIPSLRGSSECLRLWGPRYAVVADAGGRSRPARHRLKKIVVVFGAADPAKQSEQALRELSPLAARFDLTLVVGPLFDARRRRDIHRRAARAGVTIVDSPVSLTPTFERADAVLTAFGQTCLEALALQLPLLLWHPSAAHAAAAAAFADEVGRACAVDFGEGSSGILSLSRWLEAAASHRGVLGGFRPARDLDGGGAERIADHIVALDSQKETTPPVKSKGVRVA